MKKLIPLLLLLSSVAFAGPSTLRPIKGDFLSLPDGSIINLPHGLGTPAKVLIDPTGNGFSCVNKAGDTMTGPLILNANPTTGLGAATKQYVDSHSGNTPGGTANAIQYNNGDGGFNGGTVQTDGNNISILNTNSYRFNGAGDANWVMGRNLANFASPFLSPLISTSTLDIAFGNASNEGFVIGNNGGQQVLNLDYNLDTWLAHNLNLGNDLILTGVISDNSDSNITSIDTNNRALYSSGEGPFKVLDYQNGILYPNNNTHQVMNWSQQILYDNVGSQSIDWNNRELFSNAIGQVANWTGPSFQLNQDLDANNYNLINLANPINSQDAATKGYVDATTLKVASVTLTPSMLANLQNYPGTILVDGTSLAANQAIVVSQIEFHLVFNSTPYTTTANLFLNYVGNYTGGQKYPAGNTANNSNFGLLTSSREFYRAFNNTGNDFNIPFGGGSSLLLNADGPITGGNSNLVVRVSYKIVTLP